MKRITIALLLACGALSAQTPAQERDENASRTAAGLVPVYRVTVTQRTAKAISYKNRSGASKIDFSGTELMQSANGQAKVESKQGRIEIEAQFRNLQEPPNSAPSVLPTFCGRSLQRATSRTGA